MQQEVYENIDEIELAALARRIADQSEVGSIIALTGQLGVGKTVFAKAMAVALGVRETVTSPTFTIVKEYEGYRLPFYHFDVYRMETPDETEMMGFEEYFYGRGVCAVEWADNIRDYLPEDVLHVDIAYGSIMDTRTVTVGGAL